jgi:hypothetical protein
MKRITTALALAAVAGLLAPTVFADVKTTQKTTFKLEGIMGRFLNSPKEGILSTIAVKGNRMSRLNDATGEIVDLTEEKVYQIDVKKKQYTVKTFAQLRQEMEEARAKMDKQAQSGKPDEKQTQQADSQMEIDVAIKETGERKTISGHETKEVVMILTMRQKGQKLEEGGGVVTTSDMWIAPRVAQLEELMAFQLKYYKAVYGSAFSSGDMQQAAALSSMLPGFAAMSEKMAAEGKKMQGTPLVTTTTMESVKSAEQMKAAAQPADQPKPSGIGGMLGSKLGPKPAPPQQRTLVMTTSSEYTAIESAASDADVAIPVGFKEKK